MAVSQKPPSIDESLARVRKAMELAKSQGNTRQVKVMEKVIKRLESLKRNGK